MYFTDILKDFHRMQNEMARTFRGSDFNYSEFPLVQIFTSKDHLSLRVEIPGISADQIELTITDDVATISGEIKIPQEIHEMRFLRQERKTGKFQKTIELPYSVEGEHAEAVFKNGVLTVTLPIKEALKPKTIAIKSE